jgi:hypothetical protein
MARPKIVIDSAVVETLAKVGATNCEIADHFMVDEGTIRKRFSDLLAKARSTRKIKLREMQWKLAEKGNLGMMIWLGKQELGQSEKVEQKIQSHSTVLTAEVTQKKLEDAYRIFKSKLG